IGTWSITKALSNMTDSYYVSQVMRSYHKVPKSDMVRAQKASQLSDTCDLLQYALGILHNVTLVTDGRKLVVSATVLIRSGIVVILDATHGAGYVDPEEVDDEWLMASVMLPSMPTIPPPSSYEVGKPSTAAPELPFLLGRLLLEVVSSVIVHHEEIGGLFVRIENLEHAHGVLVRKIGEVSDAQLDDGIAIGEIRPRVTTLEGQVDGLREDVDGLLGLKERVQTLESIVHELRKENQKLRGLLSAREGDQSMLASYVLGLGERLTKVELQFPRPPLGPQLLFYFLS
nr:DDB1- and CUL4-associated factor homolog 1 [Tanacetum cinerariifolium]